MPYIAHVRKSDKSIQTLEEHLFETSHFAALLAKKLGLENAGALIGLMHDFGKYSRAFQEYIRFVTSQETLADQDGDASAGGKVDHSTAGAQWIYRHYCDYFANDNAGYPGKLFGQMLGLCVASHHGLGLIDCLNENGEMNWLRRFDKADDKTNYEECLAHADKRILEKADALSEKAHFQKELRAITTLLFSPKWQASLTIDEQYFYLACYTKFLHSCLIDADRISTADFEHPENQSLRQLAQIPDWFVMIAKLERHLSQLVPKEAIDTIRQSISATCLSRAEDAQGCYTLTVPTGGGKTLASLRYALHHAEKYHLDRIIYIIPYTSIIEQNARVVRDVLGAENVLEAHSNLGPEQQTWQSKILAENWDKPVVFTTMVQFLEAFFGAGNKNARHIHPLTKSVLIFDEIQTLPINCIHLFCNIINWLTQFGHSTALMCSATQPTLDRLENKHKPMLRLTSEHPEIMGNVEALKQQFAQLSRVVIHNETHDKPWSLDETAQLVVQKYLETQSVLVIMNTKKWALTLYQRCQALLDEAEQSAIFHLSTNMCPVHRENCFAKIRERLTQKQPVLCISTQLIEAGVDISLKCVIRALAGMDNIAQAAGRCNRHGELGKDKKGDVIVVNLADEKLDLLPDIKKAQTDAERVLREFQGQDLLAPEVMTQYFQYYFYSRQKEMSYNLEKGSESVLSLLSANALNPGYKAFVKCQEDGHEHFTRFPLLQQSFRRAALAFEAIDAPTQALIVPYGEEGTQLINDLCSAWDGNIYALLAKAQRYSINVFPNVWKKLAEAQVIHEVQENTGIYYLVNGYYNEEVGLDGGKMSFNYF